MTDIGYQDFLHGRLKLRHLVVALTIAEEGSTLAAAEQLQMSQPAISRIVHELEKILSAPLFVRTSKGMKPTAAATPFLAHARVALAHAREAVHAVRDLSEGTVGTVRVGIHIAGANLLLPRAIISLREELPGIDVVVREGAPRELLQLLVEGEINLLVTRSGNFFDAIVIEGEQVTFEVLQREKIPLVVSVGSPFASRPGLKLAELTDERWILPTPGTMMREELERQFAASDLNLPRDVTEVNSVHIIKTLVKEGGYVAAVPRTMVESMGDVVELRVEDHHLTSSTGVAWLKGHPSNEAARAMIQHLQKARQTLG